MRSRHPSRIALVSVAVSVLTACATQPPPASPRDFWPPEARSSHVPSDMWRLRLRAERRDDIASLEDGAGTRLCMLPCTALVPPMAGFAVHVATSSGSPRRLEIPNALDDVSLGESATVVARPKRGHPGAAFSLTLSGLLLTGVGTLLFGAGAGGGGGGGSAVGLLYGAGMAAIGVPMTVVGFVWGGYSQPPSLEVLSQ